MRRFRLLTLTYLAGLALAVIGGHHPVAAKHDELRIGITSLSPPYSTAPDAQNGLDPELLRLIIERTDHNAMFVPAPFNRRTVLMQQGKIDAITFWTQPEDVFCHETEPYRFWRNALFHMPAEGLPKSYDQSRVGIFLGSEHLRERLRTIGLNHDNLQKLPTVGAAVRMLMHGRLDGYVGDYPTVQFEYRKEASKEKRDPAFDPYPLRFLPPEPQRLCFIDMAHRNAFNTALNEIIEITPEKLYQITQKYGLKERITPPLDN